MSANFVPVRNRADADAFFANRDERPLGYASKARRGSGHSVIYTHHETDIATTYLSAISTDPNPVAVHTGGYASRTTLDRVNAVLNAARIPARFGTRNGRPVLYAGNRGHYWEDLDMGLDYFLAVMGTDDGETVVQVAAIDRNGVKYADTTFRRFRVC